MKSAKMTGAGYFLACAAGMHAIAVSIAIALTQEAPLMFEFLLALGLKT